MRFIFKMVFNLSIPFVSKHWALKLRFLLIVKSKSQIVLWFQLIKTNQEYIISVRKFKKKCSYCSWWFQTWRKYKYIDRLMYDQHIYFMALMGMTILASWIKLDLSFVLGPCMIMLKCAIFELEFKYSSHMITN